MSDPELFAVIIEIVHVETRIEAIQETLEKIHGAHARDYTEELKVLKKQHEILRVRKNAIQKLLAPKGQLSNARDH